eukprot:gene6722-22625_t
MPWAAAKAGGHADNEWTRMLRKVLAEKYPLGGSRGNLVRTDKTRRAGDTANTYRYLEYRPSHAPPAAASDARPQSVRAVRSESRIVTPESLLETVGKIKAAVSDVTGGALATFTGTDPEELFEVRKRLLRLLLPGGAPTDVALRASEEA